MQRKDGVAEQLCIALVDLKEEKKKKKNPTAIRPEIAHLLLLFAFHLLSF